MKLLKNANLVIVATAVILYKFNCQENECHVSQIIAF